MDSWVVVSNIFCIFIPLWGRFPCWLIFFRWVEATNQIGSGWLSKRPFENLLVGVCRGGWLSHLEKKQQSLWVVLDPCYWWPCPATGNKIGIETPDVCGDVGMMFLLRQQHEGHVYSWLCWMWCANKRMRSKCARGWGLSTNQLWNVVRYVHLQVWSLWFEPTILFCVSQFAFQHIWYHVWTT